MARPQKYNRERIAEMVEQGMTALEIAVEMEAPVKSIHHILRVMGLSEQTSTRNSSHSALDSEVWKEREETILSMFSDSSLAEMSEALGLHISTISQIVMRLREDGRLPPEDESRLGYTIRERNLIIRFLRDHLEMSWKKIGAIWGISAQAATNSYHRFDDE